MRLRACPGLLMLAVGGCAHLPDRVSVDVDGTTVEIRKKPAASDAPPPPAR